MISYNMAVPHALRPLQRDHRPLRPPPGQRHRGDRRRPSEGLRAGAVDRRTLGLLLRAVHGLDAGRARRAVRRRRLRLPGLPAGARPRHELPGGLVGPRPMSIYLSIYLAINQSIYPSICVSIYLSIYLCIYLSIYLSIQQT